MWLRAWTRRSICIVLKTRGGLVVASLVEGSSVDKSMISMFGGSGTDEDLAADEAMGKGSYTGR